VPDLDATAADEREMLGPRLGLDGAHHPRHGVEPTRFHGRGRREAERNAVDDHGNLGRERAERSQRAPPRRVPVVRDHFDHVEAVEIPENPPGELRPPSQAHAIHQSPPPPPQPPQPPPSPPPPHEEPQDEPHDDDVWRRRA